MVLLYRYIIFKNLCFIIPEQIIINDHFEKPLIRNKHPVDMHMKYTLEEF